MNLADYDEINIKYFKKLFNLPDCAPNQDTFQRLFNFIHADQFIEQFTLFTSMLAEVVKDIIAIDEKTIHK